MIRSFIFVFLVFSLFISPFSVIAFADGAEGTVATSAAVPDASAPTVSDLGTLSDINDNLGVIQSLLWVIVIFLVCSILWKFFRWFF